MPSWPAQGLRFSGLQHPPSENANFALASKSSKSIEDSSKMLDFTSFNKIVISVVDDTPSARMTFLQLSTPRRCKIRTLAREISCSARHCSPSRFKSRSCHDRAWDLSSWSLELVTFKPGSCQVQAWNLSSSSLGLVRFEPRTWRSRTRESASSRRSLAEKPTGILSSSSRKLVTRTPHAATKPTSCRRRALRGDGQLVKK